MNNFLQVLQSDRILLSDGSTGVELQNRGLPPEKNPAEYNISHPQIVQQLHKEYFEAGSDIVETNTFGGNRISLGHYDLQNRVGEISTKSAELVRGVCPPDRFVAGSVGPTGEILEPLGTMTTQDCYDVFAEQVEALAQAGVDVIFVETMMAAEEAEIAIQAVKERTELPVVATMTFEKGNMGLRTQWGVDIATAVARLSQVGADVIGSNCGRGFDEMIEIIEEMRPLTTKPIIAQSNAGIPESVNGVSVYKETPEWIVPKAEKLLQLGVNILGGCCGTGPDHIRKMRSLVDQFN